MSRLCDVIKSPLITEITVKLAKESNVYTFKVINQANKIEISKAIAEQFSVTVLDVNTLKVLPKFKRQGKYEGYTNSYKKAYVKLKKGDRIDAFVV
jgi:large subunit ribosomal protein L23